MPTKPPSDIELKAVELNKVPSLMAILKKAMDSQDDTLQQLNKAAAEYEKIRYELPNGHDAEMKKVVKELDNLYMEIKRVIPVLQDTPSEQGKRRLVFPVVRANNNLAGHLKKVEELNILEISKRFSYLANSPNVRQKLAVAVDKFQKVLSHINGLSSQEDSEKLIQQESEKFEAKIGQILRSADMQVQGEMQVRREEWLNNLSLFEHLVVTALVVAMIIPMVIIRSIHRIIDFVVTSCKDLVESIKNENHHISKATTTFFKLPVPADQDSVLQPEEALKQGENPTTPEKK